MQFNHAIYNTIFLLTRGTAKAVGRAHLACKKTGKVQKRFIHLTIKSSCLTKARVQLDGHYGATYCCLGIILPGSTIGWHTEMNSDIATLWHWKWCPLCKYNLPRLTCLRPITIMQKQLCRWKLSIGKFHSNIALQMKHWVWSTGLSRIYG